MKIFHLFLAFILVFWLVIIGIWITPEPAAVSGQLHPEFHSMLKSGTSVSSSPTIKWLSYFFGLGIFGIMGFMILIGARKKDKTITRKIHARILLSFVLIFLVYSITVFSYWDYASTTTTSYFGGLPTPTSWMVYGIWFTPLVLVFIYIFKFDQWIISSEELRRFQEIVEKRRERERKTIGH